MTSPTETPTAIGEDSNMSADSVASECNISAATPIHMEQDETIKITGDEASSSSIPVVVAPSQPSTPNPKLLTRLLTADTTHIEVQAKDVIEFEWPIKSGDKWFLQEQIGELLDIKSFSRKFPDLSRRKVEKNERDWLCTTYKIQDIMNETQLRDLCAMRSMEIHDLMASEYPGIYQEYQRVSANRLKAVMMEQAKEMEAIKNDSKRLAELREKAMKSARDFNHDLQAIKNTERKHYWDIQTNMIQSGTNKWKRLPAKFTRVDPYPVAVILGQYQSYYKKFTPEEMRKLPLGTVLDSEQLYPVYREPSPPPISVSDRDIQRFERLAAAQAQQQQNSMAIATAVGLETTPKAEVPVRKTSASSVRGKCSMCGGAPMGGHRMVKCASCPMEAHSDCLEMTAEMTATVHTYGWNCIDCKKCTVCSKTDREDTILFCDRCDRGYHTFCVGLNQAPEGKWLCDKFCAAGDKASRLTPSRSRATRRGSNAVVA